jgi:hypothetical protein
MLNVISLVTVAVCAFGITLDIVVYHAANTKEGYAAYSIDLLSGWRPQKDTDPSSFVTPNGEKLRFYDYIDKKGDTLHVECMVKPPSSLVKQANDLLAFKPANSNMKIIKQRIGKYQSGLIIIQNRRHTKTGVAAQLVDRDAYIRVVGEYVGYPSAAQIACFEKMAATIRIIHA